MIFAIRRRDTRSAEHLEEAEREELLAYLERAGAITFAMKPGTRTPEIYFTIAAGPAAERAVDTARLPKGFQLFSADFDYMPLAWSGDETAYRQHMSWYFDLPKNHREL